MRAQFVGAQPKWPDIIVYSKYLLRLHSWLDIGVGIKIMLFPKLFNKLCTYLAVNAV